ncbi:MAG: PEP-CTERM sorting domain-containing protein [Planctomycetota bacterium]
MTRHNTKLRSVLGVLALGGAVLCGAGTANAQFFVEWGAGGGPGDYQTASNWLPFGTVPTTAQSDIAIISNGGAATLSGFAPNVGGVRIGADQDFGGANAIGTGSLIIDGGSLISEIVSTGFGDTDGRVNVGDGAQPGTLAVLNGGVLDTVFLESVIGGGDTSITVDGFSSVSSQFSILRSDVRIVGPNASFVTNELQLTGQATLTAQITGPTHTAINATSLAQIGGTDVVLEFDGYSPVVGDSYTLIQSQTLLGGIGAVTTNATLGAGQNFDVEEVTSGGTTSINVSVEEVLTLNVNRADGSATITSDSGSTLGLIGYSIGSAGGNLTPGAWVSLADVATGSFVEANPTANALSELDSSTAGISVAGGASVALGQIYNPTIPAFGTPSSANEDLTFTVVDDTGRELTALVNFEGAEVLNNLVLTVDPATGNARITNDSQTDIDLDYYAVFSESGSLLPGWMGLEDAAVGDWDEIGTASGTAIGELEPFGVLDLDAGQSVDLTGIWDTVGGTQDLTFEFQDDVLGLIQGVVVYDTISDGLGGDYNGDGMVDGADYALFRNNLGLSPDGVFAAGSRDPNASGNINADDLAFWLANFGAGGLGSGSLVGAVPEPSTLLVTLPLAAAAFLRRTRRRSPAASLDVAVERDAMNHSPQPSWSAGMLTRYVMLAALCLAPAAAVQAQPVTILGDSTATQASFTDGLITIEPFGAGGVPTTFGPNMTFIGPLGGSNDNATDNDTNNPLDTSLQERLDLTFDSSVGLASLEFGFTRAQPIIISGFSSDPLAQVGMNPNNDLDVAYVASTGSVLIYHPFFSGTRTSVNFGNTSASAGQTLSIVGEDSNQDGLQIAISGITYDVTQTLIAGDVDGMNGADPADFAIIQANFLTGSLRSEGDLTGDGMVDLQDYLAWADAAGVGPAGLQALLSVPEPTSMMLGAFAVLGLARRRRG